MNQVMTNAAQNDACGLLFPILIALIYIFLIALIYIFVRLGKNPRNAEGREQDDASCACPANDSRRKPLRVREAYGRRAAANFDAGELALEGLAPAGVRRRNST